MGKPPYDPDKLPPDLRSLLPQNRRASAVTPAGETHPEKQKSSAQVASSVAPQVAPAVSPNSTAGRSPKPHDRALWVSYGIKLKAGELSILRNKAKGLGLTVNAYIRAKALGEDYIQKPPSWLRDILLKHYVELAAQGNNLNQLAHRVNMNLITAEEAIITANRHRMPLLRTLELIQMALAGRRPPDDY